MASITTRETSATQNDRTGITLKNSPLTNAEIDTNFIELNNDKLEQSDAQTTATADTVVLRTGTGGANFADLDVSGQIDAGSLILDTALAIAEGGTGATTAAGARDTLGLDTDNNVQFQSLGIGTAASGTTGEIRATNNIISHYSDERLKENIQLIDGALNKVDRLRGVTYNPNSIAEQFGFSTEQEVGVIAQDVKEVLPEAVKSAPFDRMILEGQDISRSGQEYMTVQYEKLVPLLVEAIKELNKEIKELKGVK